MSWLAIAAPTRTKTSTGATAFRADTKSVPRKPMSTASPGMKYAVSEPKMRAMTICFTSDPPRIRGIAR